MKKLQKFDINMGKENIDTRYDYIRVSRWIKIEHTYNPGKNNRLWDHVIDANGYHPYQDDFNAARGLFLDYFRHGGKTYAIEQFAAFGSIMDSIGHFTGYIENGQKYFLSGYNMDDYCHPYIIELDEYGERVRLYEERIKGA